MTHCFYDFHGLRKAQQEFLFQAGKSSQGSLEHAQVELVKAPHHSSPLKMKKRAASDARLLLTSSFDSDLCFLLLAVLTPYIFIYLIKITLVYYVMQPSESLYLIPRNTKVCYLHCQSGYLYLDFRSSCHLSSSSRMPSSSWSCSVSSPTYHLPDASNLFTSLMTCSSADHLAVHTWGR